MAEMISAKEASLMTANKNNGQWELWQKEWKKVQHSIAETITGAANHGHRQVKFNLKTVEFTEIAKNLDYLKHAFVSRGYDVNLKLERSPNGAREMTVIW